MKNIHLISTDKPSRLHFDDKLFLSTNPQISKDINSIVEGRNIYITYSEGISGFENNIWVIQGTRVFLWKNTMALVSNYKPRKIILTTDKELIKDGVQAIDDEFLEWFVKNPSCETVEIDRDEREVGNHLGGVVTEYGDYKIIIPEEPKSHIEYTNTDDFTSMIYNPQEKLKQSVQEYEQQGLEKYSYELETETRTMKEQTLEEFINSQPYYGHGTPEYLEGIEVGAKWQQKKMFTEEQLAIAMLDFGLYIAENRGKPIDTDYKIKEIIEQFKQQEQ
jgi:Txe/YoeB family toxin of Txe-Axe toxin-antitoxin module